MKPNELEKAPAVCGLCLEEWEELEFSRSIQGWKIVRKGCMAHGYYVFSFWEYVSGPYKGYIVPDSDR